MFRKFIIFYSFLLVFRAAPAQNTVKVQAGAIFKMTGNEVVTLQDMNLDNDGAINLSPGDGKFRFSGVQNNTISGNSVPLFDVLEIIKTGNNKLSLLGNINIGSSINFTSGLIDLNNKIILLQPNAVLATESELSHLIGFIGGYVEISTILNAPSSVNPGNLGAVISTSQNLGNTTIRRGHKSQVNGAGNGNSIYRYYDIIPSNNVALNATFRFRYFDAELNGLDENTLVFWKSSDNLSWINQGFTTRDIAVNYVERTGISDFSRWTLTSPTNTLPLLFTSFNATCTGPGILLRWETANELNASRFAVERSADGILWTMEGTYPATGSSTGQRYAFTDPIGLPSGAFYRITEYDVSGQTHLSSVIHINCGPDDSWQVMPNPVSEQLMITIHSATASPSMFRVYDESGKLVITQQNSLLPGFNRLMVDMRSLPAGSYIVKAEWSNGLVNKIEKIIRQ